MFGIYRLTIYHLRSLVSGPAHDSLNLVHCAAVGTSIGQAIDHDHGRVVSGTLPRSDVGLLPLVPLDAGVRVLGQMIKECDHVGQQLDVGVRRGLEDAWRGRRARHAATGLE